MLDGGPPPSPRLLAAPRCVSRDAERSLKSRRQAPLERASSLAVTGGGGGGGTSFPPLKHPGVARNAQSRRCSRFSELSGERAERPEGARGAETQRDADLAKLQTQALEKP
ncbi:hypothetical protein PHYPO_G00187410 [Pangasianodon hypophthalmus]|uniref:Uncharacterized protein n=1 Tax=Pangasianodon hypophthalmus TaxID=310915 RepID=A0A5N5JD71_PANHP|nr:hypothetical protein PHYPO_G00187410 [Pangasianodon hypophthalmus]